MNLTIYFTHELGIIPLVDDPGLGGNMARDGHAVICIHPNQLVHVEGRSPQHLVADIQAIQVHTTAEQSPPEQPVEAVYAQA